jgi:hypothetical protein
MTDVSKSTEQPVANSSSWIVPFAIKTCLLAVVISACTIFVVDSIIDSVEDATARAVVNVRAQLMDTPIGGQQFWIKLEHELDRAADPASDLPPEKKQKLINDMRVIVARWRPFVDTFERETQKPPSAD